jgi:putative DNA primase/helicase
MPKNKSPGALAGATGVLKVGPRQNRHHHSVEPRAPQRPFDALVPILVADIEALAVALLGQPTIRTRTEWRWGRKGSLSLSVAGPKRGLWYDFDQSRGGDVLALIVHLHGGSLHRAAKWAREFAVGASEAYRSATIVPKVSPRHAPAEDVHVRTHRALRIWNETEALGDNPATTYLSTRGIPS